MEKKNLILTGLGIGITAVAGGIYYLLRGKKNVKKRSNDDVKGKPISREEIFERLEKYSSRYLPNYYKDHTEGFLNLWDFPENYYFFCIHTFSCEIKISIVSGTNKEGIIKQKEVYKFYAYDYGELISRFKLISEKPEFSDEIEHLKNLSEAAYGYDFGYALWQGSKNHMDHWYRSTPKDLWRETACGNRYNISGKPGGEVEVRALVSETVFNKMKDIVCKNENLYDLPAREFMDQLDAIFEEELVRPRTKKEMGV